MKSSFETFTCLMLLMIRFTFSNLKYSILVEEFILFRNFIYHPDFFHVCHFMCHFVHVKISPISVFCFKKKFFFVLFGFFCHISIFSFLIFSGFCFSIYLQLSKTEKVNPDFLRYSPQKINLQKCKIM